MLRIALIILITIGCFMLGQVYCSKAKSKLNQLKELKKSFSLLDREISVSLSDLATGFKNVAERCNDEVIGQLFEKISNEINDDTTFNEVFENNISNSKIELNNDLKNTLISAGKGFGYRDIESNENMINLIIKELEDYIAVENSQMSDRLKVYRTISTATGICIAIILI